MDNQVNSGMMKGSVDDQAVDVAKANKKIDFGRKRSHSMSSVSRNSLIDYKTMPVPILDTSTIERDIVEYETGRRGTIRTDVSKNGNSGRVNDLMRSREAESNMLGRKGYSKDESYTSLLNYANYGVSDIHANNTRRFSKNNRSCEQAPAETNVVNSNGNVSTLADSLKIEDPTKRVAFGKKIDVIELFMKTDKGPKGEFSSDILNNRKALDELLMPPPASRPIQARKPSVSVSGNQSSRIGQYQGMRDASVTFKRYPTNPYRTCSGFLEGRSPFAVRVRKRPRNLLTFSSSYKKKVLNYPSPLYDAVSDSKLATATTKLFPRTPAEAIDYNTSNSTKSNVLKQCQSSSSLESIQGIVSALNEPTITEEVVIVDDVIEQEKYDRYLLYKLKE